MNEVTYDYKLSDLLTPGDTANILNISPDTLAIWRYTKRYNLRYIKIGRKVFYQFSDILNFLLSRTIGAEK